MKDNDTVTMNVSLPKPLKTYVDGKVSSGNYSSASELVREAIREKMRREEELKATIDAIDGLDRKLVEGINSGSPIVVDEGYFERKKAALLARVKGRHAKT